MELKKITIENFKSIEKDVIEIKKIGKKNCFILLGINESGKSNILEAIALKDNLSDLNYEDLINKSKEEENAEIKITYEFEITTDCENSYKKYLIEKKEEPKELIEKLQIEKIERIFILNPENKKRNFFIISLKESEISKKYTIVRDNKRDFIKEIEKIDGIEGLEIQDINKVNMENYLSKNFNDFFEDNTPKIIFWKSEEKYLINKTIDLNIFMVDLENSIPLKNCFLISEVSKENIVKKIKNTIDNPQKKSELENLLSKKITTHINNIWKEHKIDIKITIDNQKLTFLVQDKDNEYKNYGVSQRSDGFKQFISILLNLSIENATNNLNNKIILLDEPENHLHPSGQKYLLNEILKISEKNYVFFATHSIYMVDKKNLSRHFSITKEESQTRISQIEENNPYKEEVLYNALGTSILEHIESNVLIFEGKTDKDIFELYCRKFVGENITIPKISLISADGVKSIIKYCKFFNRELIKSYILVDSDEEGRGQKTAIQNEPNYDNTNTFEINDIEPIKDDAELEDLFDKKHLEEILKEKYTGNIELDKEKQFGNQVKKFRIENKEIFKGRKKEELKELFFKKISNLNKEELKKEKYYSFFKKLIKKIN